MQQSSSEPSQDQDIVSRADTVTSIRKAARLGVQSTLTFGLLLLAADFLGRGWSTETLRFMSENVIVAMVTGIAVMVVTAIAAMTCLALWKR